MAPLYENTLGHVDSYELPEVATGESSVFTYSAQNLIWVHYTNINF
jgi:hypothetical protein